MTKVLKRSPQLEVSQVPCAKRDRTRPTVEALTEKAVEETASLRKEYIA